MANVKLQQTVSEQDLVQMARQEENNLLKKQAIIEKLSGALKETATAKDILQEVQKAEGKLQIAIGAMVLIEVQAGNREKCKRGISENAFKEENIKDTIEWLAKKEERLSKQIEKISAEYAEGEQRYTNLVGVLKQIDTEKRKSMESAKKAPPTISK